MMNRCEIEREFIVREASRVEYPIEYNVQAGITFIVRQET